MTTIEDNLSKEKSKLQALSDVMAKKRKLYLFKRVKRLTDDDINEDSNTLISNFNAPKQNLCNTANYDIRTSDTSTSQSLINKSNSNSLSNGSLRNKTCFNSVEPAIDIKKNFEKRYDYEYNPELRICSKINRLSESNGNTSPKLYSDCSCNTNCHSSCRLSYHHNIVLKYKAAHKAVVGHNKNNNIYINNNNNDNNANTNNDIDIDNNSNNQEIYMRNSYYTLRNLKELNSKNQKETSCVSTVNISSQCTMSTVMLGIELEHADQKSINFSSFIDTCNKQFPVNKCNRLFTTSNVYKMRFILQFYNIVMILKTLLALANKMPLSLLCLYPSPSALPSPFYDNNIQITKRPKNLQHLQPKQRLKHFTDEQYCRWHKQKSSLHTTNVSFTKMLLIGLSFLSIFLPLSQALSLDFEETLKSSLTALERSPRDVGTDKDLAMKQSSPQEQVRLARPEYVCKSLDIRNTVSQFRQLENCTVIEGFLLVTLLNANSLEDYNETFPLLTEITDYLIVYQVHYLQSIGRIFPNLSVIRGRDLFEGYALIVFSNSHLEEIGLTKLTTISKGGIRIEKNVMLCFVKSIDWTQIVSNTTDIVIEDNRDTIECPACPGDQWGTSDSSAGQNELVCKERHGRHHCWNSKSCQKFCPKRCRNNCIDENTCCNEACLGGCSSNNLNECISCRNFSIYNTTCIDKCPDNYYKFLERRCVTAETCSIIGSIYEHNQQEDLVAIHGSCSTACPEGYTKVNKTCVDCRNECTKKCEGGFIESGARAKDFHGCTHIVTNPLIIKVKRGGDHLMKDLAHGLSSVTTIETSLKVHGTFGVFDLKFFKNLQKIEGRNLIDSKYAFYVIENADIEKIWNPNQTVQILKGTVYFHFNAKLCMSEINSLLPMLNQSNFDTNDVSEDSNGSKGSCNTSLLVNVTFTGSFVAIVAIENPMVYEDERTFIGYQYLYTEDPFGNATIHTVRPCEDTWKISEPTKNTVYIFSNLNPYTRYAFYVKTLTISSERRNAQSKILHFKTKSDQPNRVNNLHAYSNSSYNIVMNWLPPSAANGKLVKYKVRAVYDKRIQRIESRNYCKDPLKEVSKPEIPITPITEKPTIPKDCNCKKTSAHTYDDEEYDASLLASIELENTLQNFVYVKKENKNKSNSTNVNSNNLLDQNGNRTRRSIEGDPSDSFLLRHIRDIPTKENLMYDVTTATSTTTTSDPQTDNNLSFSETRMDAEGEHYVVVVDSINATTTEYVFTKLKHFSWYILGVEACREKDSINDTSPLCSIEVKTYVRTLKLESVDRVEEFSAARETTNSSRSNIRLFWKQPKRPNGAVVSYTILYLLQAPDAVEEKKCITEADYIELEYQQYGYLLTNLNPGNYSIRISTNTLAGEGQYSKTIFVDIPRVDMSLKAIIITFSVLGVVLIGFFTYIFYICRKRFSPPPSDLKMFPTVNPHYISLQYIPDEWELNRETVLLTHALGQGSFGMVYEGFIRDSVKCAIKTVNENATDRERMNFLNEACVMKQFNTYHVVRLLGVCSIGQPALVVMELMKNGDLKSYLRAHRPYEADERRGMPSESIGIDRQPPDLSRIYQMAIEIADGMAYLAAKKFVHRDLAARNCMVAEDLTVKIGDFGMTRDIYENDYYRKGTKGLLPVRWMSPESLRDGIYSTASDAFSYGVVLWEMATFASQPYQGLSNDQVLRYVVDGGVMERPENCPDRLYFLMQKCWHHRPSARPTFMEIIGYLVNFSEPHFREVSFYHSKDGQAILEKEIAERSHSSGDVFNNRDDVVEDVRTPLRSEEYSGYNLNADNNLSVEHPGDPSMVIDDEEPHQPQQVYSLGESPIETRDQMLNSAPTGYRRTSPSAGYFPPAHTHPNDRNLHQPTRYTQQQQQPHQYRSDDVDSYVHPGSNRKDEQGYEIYDPSTNYMENANAQDDDEDDPNINSNAGQNLLSGSKSGQRQPTISPLSSSVPNEPTAQPAPFKPFRALAAAPSTSLKSRKYQSLRAVADSLGNNVTSKVRNFLQNSHKRSGSNASHKSSNSNPNSAITGGSNSGSSNNLTRRGPGKSMSGQNLSTIESGGSGSAGSHCGNIRPTNATIPNSSTSENPNYKRLDYGSGETLPNRAKLPSSSPFSMSSNPNYQVLEESLNTTGASTSTHNPALINSSLHTSTNPNYQLMQAPSTQDFANVSSSYVMMNEPKNKKPNVISISNNPNYQMMGPPPAPSELTGSMSSSVLPQSPMTVSQTTGVSEHFPKYPSSSSSSNETDDEDGIQSDRIPLSSDRSQKKKHLNNRSRSVSSSSRSSNTTTTTSQQQQQEQQQQQQQTPTTATTSSIASSTLLTKEKWLNQQPTQSLFPPPPNGFVGRGTS